MIYDRLKDINDSLNGNFGKMRHIETKKCKLSGRLTEIRGDELWFERRNGSVWLVSRKGLLALHPVRGE